MNCLSKNIFISNYMERDIMVELPSTYNYKDLRVQWCNKKNIDFGLQRYGKSDLVRWVMCHHIPDNSANACVETKREDTDLECSIPCPMRWHRIFFWLNPWNGHGDDCFIISIPFFIIFYIFMSFLCTVSTWETHQVNHNPCVLQTIQACT